MNARCFKTVFSEHLGCLVAVGEHACSQGKSSGESPAGAVVAARSAAAVFIGAVVLSMAWVGLAWASPVAIALPSGGQVVQGAASMVQSSSPTASQLTIHQASQRAAINWQSFDIGAAAKVNVVQPNAQAVLLNRVVGQSPSQIFGQLQANGHVILVNPNGVLFGKDGSVNAGSFTASTLGISDANFMAGNMVYERNGSTAGVVNQGTIQVSPGGYVALLGASVSNEGKIIAPQGGVALGSAATIRVPVSGSGRVKLELKVADINASVSNTGQIVSQGGQVYMQALALNQAAAQVIQSGSIDTSGEHGGAVHVLADGGTIKVDGSITANSTGTDDKGQTRKGGDIVIGRDEETGVLARYTNVSSAKLESQRGFVETSGDVLSTTGTRVKAAEWLLDPSNITIAASSPSGTAYADTYSADVDSVILASDIATSLNGGTSVTIATTATGSSAGNIAVNASIEKTLGTDATLTLRAHNDIVVANSVRITSTSEKLHVVLNSNSDGSGTGAIVMNSGSSISSNGGNITMGGGADPATGRAVGYSAVDRSSGILLSGASVSAAGGDIVMNGQGSAASYTGQRSMGVAVLNSQVTTSGSGNISIDGVGGQGPDTNAGIGIHGSSGVGALVQGGSTGTVRLIGQGGTGGDYNFGVWASDRSQNRVTTLGGDLVVQGTGGGSGSSQYNTGVLAQNSASLNATGAGSINLTGVGGNSTGGTNHGVEVLAGASINTASGTLSITGQNTATTNHGLGLALKSGGKLSAINANITVTADSFTSDSSSSTIHAGTGTVTLQNRTAGTLIDVGGTSSDVLTGTLKLGISSVELGRITANAIVVGRRDVSAAGNVAINALNMGAMGNTGGSLSMLSGGNIAVNDSITKTAGTDATLSLLANGNISVTTNKTITSTAGKLNVIFNSDSDGLNGGGIVFNTGSGVTSNGGNITLGGGAGLDGLGIAAGDGVMTTAGIGLATASFDAGGGSIAMTGRTWTSAPPAQSIHGVSISNGSIQTSGNGTINITGYNNTTATNAVALSLGGVTITGGSTGLVSLTGDARAASSSGSYLYGMALGTGTKVTSAGGNISVTGYGGNGSGGFSTNIGVAISGGVVAGVGAGTVTISGTGGQGSKQNWGVWTNTATGSVTSQGAGIEIIGQGGNGASSVGILVGAGAIGVAASTTSANVILTTDSLDLNAAINAGTGTATIQNKTASTLINVGGADVLNTSPLTLGVTNAEMNRITAGTLKIGSTTSGAMTTSAAVTTAATTGNLHLQSGNTLTASTDITSGAGLLLQTTGGALSTTAALSGTNVSLDNTAGTINWGTGALTAGTSSGSATNAVNIDSSITATGNVNILGNVATTTNTGVNLTNAGSITSSGTAATINIAANGNIANAAAIKNSGATGTGANINLTSTSGTITGAGAIGDTTHKNASVRFTQAGTSSYSGAINAANFTKEGAGALTLNSWLSSNLTNVSNAYTVSSGSLMLDSAIANFNYPTFAPASVNVVNASTFSLSASSNGRWNNTAFNFTGGSGGGTMNLRGNPIGSASTTNTFSTSGGATNIISGVLNANSANVNFNLSSASSGTSLADGSFAALAFTQNTAGGYGLGSGGGGATTATVFGGGNLLFKDKARATTFNINAGTVQVGDGTAAVAASTAELQATNLGIAAGGKLIFNRAEAYTNASIITGAGSLIHAGTGVLTLTGDSSAFAGATTVNAGKTLAIGTGGSLGAAGSTLALNDGTSNLSFTNTSGTSTVASSISGLGTVTENGGGGTGVLTGNNTYSGITTLTAGTLQIGNGGTTGTLGTGSVTNNAALVFSRSNGMTVANVISGTGALTQAGTGTTVLTSKNTYTGQTHVNSGTLSLGTASTTGTVSEQYYSSQFNIASGATLDFNAPTGVTLDNRGTTFTGLGTLTKTGAGVLKWNIIGDTNFNMLAGSWIDVKEGTFVGSATYHGKWINNLSSLNVASGASFQGAEGDTRVDALTGAGSVSFGWSTLGSLTVGLNNTAAGAYNTTAGTATFSGALSGPAPLNKSGTGTQILTGTNTYTGATNITAGVLQVGDGGATGTLGTGLVTNNTSLVFNRSDTALIVGASIAGTGTVTQSGTGMTTLSANNTYSGATTVSTGSLQIGNGSNTGTLGTSAVSVSSGANLNFYRNDASLTVANMISGTGSINLKGTGVASQSSYSLTGNNSSFSGGINVSLSRLALSATSQIGTANVTVNSGASLWANGGFTINNALSLAGNGWTENTYGQLGALRLQAGTTYAGAITLAEDARIGAYSSTGFVSGAIGGSKNIEFNSGAGGAVTVTGANTYTGTTTVGAGTLQVGNGGTIGTLGTNTGAITNNGTLSIKHSDAFIIANVITGTGALTQAGTGTTTLTGDNNYNGTTTISSGTLQIGDGGTTGTLGNGGAVTLSNSANLSFLRAASTTIGNSISGTGNVSASITGASSTLTVSSPINLTSGTVNLAADSNLSVTAAIATTNATSSAVFLNAGTSTAAGTSTGGDLSFSGSGAVTVDPGGRATLFTGSLAGSTGLGIATGNNRYNSDEQSSNYTAALSGGKYAIYREAPTLNVRFNDASKTYDVQPFTGGNGLSVVSGLVNGDSSSIIGSITYSGTAQNVTNAGTYAISGTALNSQGYALSYTSGTLTVNKADLVLTGSREYDAGTTFAGQHLTATGVASQTFSLSGAGDSSNLVSKHVAGNQSVALNSVTGLTLGSSSNGGLADNYNVISTTGSVVSLTTKAASVSATGTHVTYNGNTQQQSYTSSISSGDVITVSGLGSGTNAGSYTSALSVAGADAGNYHFSLTNADLVIDKANLTLSGSRAYDAGTTFAGTHLTAVGVAGQTFTVMGAGDASNLANQNVQSNQALSSITGLALVSSANGGLVDNYNNISTTGSSVSVSPRTLTVTGVNTSVTYNGSAQTNAGATIVGKQGGDDFTVGGYGSGTNASTTSYADNLSVTGVGNTLLSNYDIHYTQGGLSIGKANLTLSGAREYDASTTFAGTHLTATGVAGQTFTVMGAGDASNLLSKNVADNQGVSLNAVTGLNLGMSTNGGLAANYNALSATGSTVQVSTKVLSAAAAVADKVYDGHQSAALGDLSGSGVVAGDRVIFQATSALFSDKNVLLNAEGQVLDKNVTVSGLSLSGADAGNYALSVNSFTTQAKITPRQLTLQTAVQDKMYDGTRAATGHVLWSGVLGADTLDVSWGDVNFVSKDVARSVTGQVLAKSVVFSNLQLSGHDSGNYSLPTAPVVALARITPKRLNIDGTSVVDKPQDGNTDAKTQVGRLTGLVGAEQLEVQALATFDSAMAGSSKPVMVRYRLSDGANGGLGGNYELPDQVLRANIFAQAGGNSVQPIKPPVDGPLVSADGATATVVQSESRDVCSSATPEKCQCHATSVAGMEICMPGLKNMLPSPPPRGRTFVEATGF